MTTNKDISYSATDQIDVDLGYDDAKIKISLFLDGDVLKAVKAAAKNDGGKYQTLINKTLRDVFVSGSKHHHSADDYARLERRVSMLEMLLAKKNNESA